MLPIEIKEPTREYINKIKEYRKTHGYIILFYWNNCYYCKLFKPVWDKLKSDYSNQVQFFEIELEDMRKNNKAFKSVTSFPNIYVYSLKDNNHIKYDYFKRDYNTVLQFMRIHINFDNNNALPEIANISNEAIKQSPEQLAKKPEQLAKKPEQLAKKPEQIPKKAKKVGKK